MMMSLGAILLVLLILPGKIQFVDRVPRGACLARGRT
jgi:hypothetical protein